MISSPCSAEQAHPEVTPPIAQQAPGHFVRGLCCSRAAQPAAEATGVRPASDEIFASPLAMPPLRFIQNPPRSRSRTAAGELEGAWPASNEIHTESPRTFRPGGFPCASSKTRRAAGHARPQGSSRGQGPPRMRSIQKALGHFVRGLPLRFIQNPPRSRSRTAAGELEGARPASNEIHTESPRTFRPGAFCILFFSCCAFSARSPASAAGSGSRRSWR